MFESTNPILNAFTVDVEDYYQVSAFAKVVNPADWDHYQSRVVNNTHRLLKVLDTHQVRGTFFILGWVADRYPHLVRDIQKSGHEIGCHSFWHRLVYNMSPNEFREDLRQACRAIEEITGERITAYRAPSFSITRKSLWALEILADEGFRFDSSIFPIHHDLYGIPNAQRFPHPIQTASGMLWEFPASVFPIGKLNLPVAGGGYFRLYPVRFSHYFLRRINHSSRRPFVFYIHPWEIDPDQPRLPGPLSSRFRHRVNLARTERKLKWMLTRYRFGSLSSATSDDRSRSKETPELSPLPENRTLHNWKRSPRFIQ